MLFENPDEAVLTRLERLDRLARATMRRVSRLWIIGSLHRRSVACLPISR